MAAQSSAKRRFMRMHLILSVLYIALVLLAGKNMVRIVTGELGEGLGGYIEQEHAIM